MIPAQWLPSLPPPANGWLPAYYEVSEDSGVLRQGEYRVDGDRVWARNDAGVRFLPRSRHRPDVVVARQMLHSWTTGCDYPPGGGSIGTAKAAHDRTKPTISHQERPNCLGVFFLYRRVVRDFGKGPCQWR